MLAKRGEGEYDFTIVVKKGLREKQSAISRIEGRFEIAIALYF